MKKVSRKLGPKFRKIRKEKGFSLKKASSEIISSPTLSRWERGKQDISISAYYDLLKRMHISPADLEDTQNNTSKLIDKILLLYAEDKVKDLGSLSKTLVADYSLSKTNDADDLLVVITACNFFLDLSGIDLTSKKVRTKLILEVSKIEHWYKQDINLFTNSQLLLDSQKIYELGKSLASKAYELNVMPPLYSRPLLNAVFVLMRKRQPQYAEKLFITINKLTFSPYDELDYIGKSFLEYY